MLKVAFILHIETRSVRRRSLDTGRLARDRRRGGVLARVSTSRRPDSGMEVPHGKAGTQEIRVSYALDGRCAPRSQAPVRSLAAFDKSEHADDCVPGAPFIKGLR